MPAGDRTGPEGMGPQTGRGAGYCAGYGAPGYMNSGYGYGRSRRRFAPGGRHGFRHWSRTAGQPGWARFRNSGWAYPPEPTPPSAEEELQMLKDQEKWLKEQLDAVQKNLAEQDSKE